MWNNWIINVRGSNQHGPGSHIIMSISSANLMAVIHTFL